MIDRTISEIGEVVLWDTTKENPPRAVVTVDIVIPVLNEASCIRDLLYDVTMARQDNWFQIQNIWVISDASTDQTHDIVQQIAAGDQRVKLFRKKERKGKQDSLNLAFSLTTADVVIFMDGDVRLAGENTIKELLCHFNNSRDGQVALVQGGLIRVCSNFSFNPAKQASYFDWIVVDKIRRQKSISWWSIDGRVMALSRDFHKHLVLPGYLADDQYIFYSCIQQDRKFVWAEDAIFYYGPPESISDFSHQWSRYFFYTNKSRQYFGKDLIDKDMCVPGLWRTIMSSFLRHPFCGLMWFLCYGISKAEFKLHLNFNKYERGFFGTKSKKLKL